MSIKRSAEYEFIQHSTVQSLEIFLVRMFSRSLHGHSDFELGVLLEGSLTLHINGQDIPLRENDIYVVNRYQSHSFSDGSENTMLLAIQFGDKMYNHLDPSIKRLQFPNHIGTADPQHPILHKLLLQCANIYFHSSNAALMSTALLLTILSVLQCSEHSVRVSEAEYSRNRSKAMRMNHLLDYILQHYMDPITLRELAIREEVSVCHLSHQFKEFTGMSFQQYVGNLRFEHALHLVEQTQLGILDICAESGYSSSRYLNQAFEERFHMGVSAYRSSCHHRSPPMKSAVSDNEIRLPFSDAKAYLRKWMANEGTDIPSVASEVFNSIFLSSRQQ